MTSRKRFCHTFTCSRSPSHDGGTSIQRDSPIVAMLALQGCQISQQAKSLNWHANETGGSCGSRHNRHDTIAMTLAGTPSRTSIRTSRHSSPTTSPWSTNTALARSGSERHGAMCPHPSPGRSDPRRPLFYFLSLVSSIVARCGTMALSCCSYVAPVCHRDQTVAR